MAVWGSWAPFQMKMSSGWNDASSFLVAFALWSATSGERRALFLPIGNSSSSRLTPGSDGASSELEVSTITSWRSRSRLTVSAHSTSYPPRTAGGKRLLITRIRIPRRGLRAWEMGTKVSSARTPVSISCLSAYESAELRERQGSEPEQRKRIRDRGDDDEARQRHSR